MTNYANLAMIVRGIAEENYDDDLQRAADALEALMADVTELRTSVEELDGDVGYTVVAFASRDDEAMVERFRVFYKPEQWLGSHRAAGSFIGGEIAALVERATAAEAERESMKALLRDCAEHFKTLRGANVFVWPNHPLNTEARIAAALQPTMDGPDL